MLLNLLKPKNNCYLAVPSHAALKVKNLPQKDVAFFLVGETRQPIEAVVIVAQISCKLLQAPVKIVL